ncbi:MAG: Gfo/Idh/MocA family oxidoreductase [Candidatus Hydrogenedentes bacterium]|nr:Gfo/Idh/MocA family oxidoreductase [Candidatus Hydrogenedentota bacterium]
MMSSEITRRAFLASTTTVALSACTTTSMNTARVVPGKISPNEKLNIAAVGFGSMGGSNIAGCSTENIVALCDVDSVYAAKVFNKYPNAKRFVDFRNMFDTAARDFDAVICATPDHTHAVVSMAAIQNGKHLYCQKPLAHSLHEVRTVTEAARAAGVQTQMGNQGHSSNSIRKVKEWIADGAIGPVHEVHAWSNRPVGGHPWSDFPMMVRPKDTPPVPESLNWDLWIGPAAMRPYHPVYHPMTWRGFYEFGTGPLGDMGCHILDPAFYALDLGHPDYVQAASTHYQEGVQDETYPRACMVKYHFPARGDMPPVDLTWYDGRLKPFIPTMLPGDLELPSNGALIVGEKGVILHKSHGAGDAQILPESIRKGYTDPAETIPRVEQKSAAHEQDWIRACKDGRPASSSFEYGGPLTEMVLIGVLAIRMKDQRLEWDGATQSITNNVEANALVNPAYREGWSL